MIPSYLFACIVAPFLFLLAAFATPSPAASASQFGVGFPTTEDPDAVPRKVTPAITVQEEPEIEVDVLPFVLVSTVDGALHAIDREAGHVRWTLRDGVEPLVGGGSTNKRGDDVEYIVEPLSGNLFVLEGDKGEPTVRKLPLTVEQLIEISPSSFPNNPSVIFTGVKQTSLLTLDLRTGQQLDHYTATPFDNASSPGVCENDLLDDLEGAGRSHRDTLFVGRTDYTLKITTQTTNVDLFSPTATVAAAKNRQETVITYSTYTPNGYNKALAEQWAKNAAKNVEAHPRIHVELGFNGEAIGIRNGKVWATKLDSVGIAVYDVVQPLSPASANPVILPQPPIDLKSLVPRSAAIPAHFHRPPSTYIGSVPFTPHHLLSGPASPAETDGQSDNSRDDKTTLKPRPLLFAQSSNAYPFVNAAPPAKPGNVNGSFPLSDYLPERDSLLPRDNHFRPLIDPPKETGAVIEPPPNEVAPVPEAPKSSNRGWAIFVFETIAVILGGAAVYQWGFSKATQAALATSGASAGSPAASTASPLIAPVEGPTGTPIVRFENLPEPGVNGGTASPDGTTPTPTPKKKSNRRRVRGRGRKGRRNSVGPRDEGEGDGEEDAESSAEERKSLDVPVIARNTSTQSLHTDQERLGISSDVIGFGSHGTVVLKGTWGGRPVAVKRLLSDFVRLASQEVKLLQASDDHPNVIRYYCQERRDNFLYIALDLCQASLADLIETPDRHGELAANLDHKKALSQITSGLKHLHTMKIVHRDIKPQNVLVSKGKDGSLRMLVSDFGLARRLEQGQSSFAPTANNLAGSLGWRAPECIRGQVKLNEGFDPILTTHSTGSTTSSTGSIGDLTSMSDEGVLVKGAPRARLTKAVDLFALGCLYFWVLMHGEHPYGETYNREANIVKGDAVYMDKLSILGEEGVEAQHLINRLLSSDPSERPDTSECLTHPFFWTPAKRLAFLCDASDRFEIMEADPPESTLVMLEDGAPEVIGKDWYSRMDRVFTSSLGKYRKYKGSSVRDLLRAMRNKKNHYQDLEPSAKRHFGALPAGFLNYFTTKFPRLFLHVYHVVRDSRLRHETMFEVYFQEKET